MKICYVVSTVNVAGGANRSLLDMLSYINSAGHECLVLGPADGSIAQALEEKGIKYQVIPFFNSVKSRSIYRDCIKRGLNVIAKKKIIKYLKEEKVDLLHNNSIPTAIAMEAAHAIGIPYVCHIRENIWKGLGMEFYNDQRIRKIIRNAKAVIVISDFIKRAYKAYEPDGHYIVINDGIDVSDYLENKEIFTQSIIHLGMVGVINPQKGQHEAVDAMEILNSRGYGDSVVLEIIGMDGAWNGQRTYAYNLKNHVIQKHIDNIIFTPAIEDVSKLKAKRRSFDINLVCSRAEGLGRITIESMLSGSLTIAADAGATPEIVSDGINGLLYKCGSSEDLADKIEYAINHKMDMKGIAFNGQKTAVERFSVERYVADVIKIYGEICDIK